jgi:hypothetical protein
MSSVSQRAQIKSVRNFISDTDINRRNEIIFYFFAGWRKKCFCATLSISGSIQKGRAKERTPQLLRVRSQAAHGRPKGCPRLTKAKE